MKAQLFTLGFYFIIILLGCSGCGRMKNSQDNLSTRSEKIDEKQANISTTIQTSKDTKPRSISSPYLPIGGTWDSILYYNLDSPMVKKYEIYGELWNQHTGIYPHAYDIKDPQDTFGRENIGIVIREPRSNKILKKINWIYEDNPFRKEGFEEFKRIRHYIYFKTPEVKSHKSKFKKYLPAYLYDEIPEYLEEGEFLAKCGCGPTLNGFTICKYTFEVEGVEREWIHGDYATSRNYIYDNKGNLILEYFGDCEDVTVDVDPSGQYAIIIKNYNVYKKYDGVPQKSCLEIMDLSTKKLVYEECEVGFAWQLRWTKFGYTILSTSNEDSHKRSKFYILNPITLKLIPINKNDSNKIKTVSFEKEKWIQISYNSDTTEYDLINPIQFTKLK